MANNVILEDEKILAVLMEFFSRHEAYDILNKIFDNRLSKKCLMDSVKEYRETP